MRLIFKHERDSNIESYDLKDNNERTMARVHIYHNTRMLTIFYLDFSDEVKENIFPLLRALKDDLNINGYKINPEYIAYNDYTDRYNTDIIE